MDVEDSSKRSNYISFTGGRHWHYCSPLKLIFVQCSLLYLCLVHNCQWVRPKWHNYCNAALFWPAMAHSSQQLLLSLDEIWQYDMETANLSLTLFLAGFFIDKMSDYGTGFLMAGVALLVSAMFLLLLHQMNLRVQGSTTKQHIHTDPTGQNSQEVKELDMTWGEENDFWSNRWWVHREIWIMKTFPSGEILSSEEQKLSCEQSSEESAEGWAGPFRVSWYGSVDWYVLENERVPVIRELWD